MKPKTMILMVVAVACGLGASYMTSKLLAERNNQRPPEVAETVPVLVAKTRVPGWTPIKDPKQYFEIKEFPKELAPSKSLSKFEDILDKRLNKPIEELKPVSQSDLLNQADQALYDKLKPGQRAIGIKVNPESLAGGWVQVDTYVDVLCVTNGAEATAKIVLQNLLVLAIDAQGERNPDQKHLIGQTVTLAASAEEAARLALAQRIGDLRLMLKGQTQNHTDLLPTIEVHPSDLGKPLRSGQPEVPAKPEEDKVASGMTDPTPLPELTQPETPAPAKETEQPMQDTPVEKPRKKPHVMVVITAGTREKHVFHEATEESGEEGTEDEIVDEEPPAKKPQPVKKPQPAKKVGR